MDHVIGQTRRVERIELPLPIWRRRFDKHVRPRRTAYDRAADIDAAVPTPQVFPVELFVQRSERHLDGDRLLALGPKEHGGELLTQGQDGVEQLTAVLLGSQGKETVPVEVSLRAL